MNKARILGSFFIFGAIFFGASTSRADVVGGRLEVIADFESRELGNERDLRVYLPQEYDSSKSVRYPVIYFHDGQNGFEDSTSDGGCEWSLDEKLSDLARRRIGPAIVVGIDSNNDNRDEEYDPAHKTSEAYMRFVVEEVKPFIDRKYRTRTDRASTWTMGASMGASISFGLVWNHSETFSAAAALSLPAMGGIESLMSYIADRPDPRKRVRIYMDHGTVGGDEGYGESVGELADALRKRGFSNSNLEYRVFSGHDHGEGDWAKRVEIPLKFLFSR